MKTTKMQRNLILSGKVPQIHAIAVELCSDIQELESEIKIRMEEALSLHRKIDALTAEIEAARALLQEPTQ